MKKLFTEVKSSKKELKVKHYVGFPTNFTENEDSDSRTLLQYPHILIIEEKPDGFYLFRYTENGDFGGETWHLNIEDAKYQATFEYETNIGEWQEMPEDVKYPVIYALKQFRTN